MLHAKKIVGYVLTGGENSRMNGAVKFFLQYDGQSFGARIIEALEELETIYLSVNKPEQYLDEGLELIVDEFEGIGPIGGICSGLHQLKNTALFVTASDTPFITTKTVKKICDAYKKKPILTLASVNGRLEPLLGIYPPELQMVVNKLVEEKHYKIRTIIEFVEYQVVSIEDVKVGFNINTPDEYLRYCNRSS